MMEVNVNLFLFNIVEFPKFGKVFTVKKDFLSVMPKFYVNIIMSTKGTCD